MAATPLPAIPELRDPDPQAFEEYRTSSKTRRVIGELAIVGAFYLGYSAVRNRFGSASVEPAMAFENARSIIRLERSLGLFFEQEFQALALNWRPLVWLLNVFYGTFHFVVTGGTLAWLYLRHTQSYRRWRNTLAATTGFAIIGFSVFPVMPPRLLADCGPYGACAGPALVDTIAEVGGLWTFDSAAVESMSNQYAAVPSLHFRVELVVCGCRRVPLPASLGASNRCLVSSGHAFRRTRDGEPLLARRCVRCPGPSRRCRCRRTDRPLAVELSTRSSTRSLLDLSPSALPSSQGVRGKTGQGNVRRGPAGRQLTPLETLTGPTLTILWYIASWFHHVGSRPGITATERRAREPHPPIHLSGHGPRALDRGSSSSPRPRLVRLVLFAPGGG